MKLWNLLYMCGTNQYLHIHSMLFVLIISVYFLSSMRWPFGMNIYENGAAKWELWLFHNHNIQFLHTTLSGDEVGLRPIKFLLSQQSIIDL